MQLSENEQASVHLNPDSIGRKNLRKEPGTSIFVSDHMKLTPSQLEAQGYILADTLPHQEMTAFVKTYIRKANLYGLGYYVLLFIQLTVLCYYFLVLHKQDILGLSNAIHRVAISFPLAFLLIPLHEYIHVLAYKSQGASNTSYDVYWRKLVFLAVADQFVANRKEFRLVALAPFVCISTILLPAICITGGALGFTLLCVLFWHSSFCGGDFALLSYFAHHKKLEVVTYDDKASKISYFYTRSLE